MKANLFIASIISLVIVFFFESCYHDTIERKNKAVKTELYFGLSKQDKSVVTDEQWNQFRDSVISQVFFNGMTILNSTGAWRLSTSDSLQTENSRVVISINEMSAVFSADIDTMRAKYCRYFDQQSVLRVDQLVDVK